MHKIMDILMSYRKHAEYKLTFKLRYKRVISISADPFIQFDQINIEFLLFNGLLLYLQYNSNKYMRVCLFKFCLIREIKRKTIDKLCTKSHLVIQEL